MTDSGMDRDGESRPDGVLALVGDIFEAMPVALVVTDATGTIVLANAQTEVLLGYDRAELVGQPVELLVPPEFRDTHPANHRRFLSRPSSRPMGASLDLTAMRKDGSRVPVEIALKPLHAGIGTVVLSVIVDISARREAEQRMLRSQHELEARVLERTAELERRNREYQAMLEALELAHQRLEQVSREDPLTGLANRREFNRSVELELERAARSGKPVALAMLDLDHFKRVNDEHGHAVGDRVLQRVATVMRGQCRAVDVVSRHGGEEFALAMPETDAVDALAICERIRTAIQDHPWSELAEGLAVTISAGLVEWVPGESLPSALSRADALLYSAKRAGRNRTAAAKRP